MYRINDVDAPNYKSVYPYESVEHLLLQYVRYRSEQNALRQRLAVLESLKVSPALVSQYLSILGYWQAVQVQRRALAVSYETFFIT